MAQFPDLMTVREVARALRVDDETVHRWAREGKLPAIRLPGRVKRFRRAEIAALLGEQTTTVDATEPAA